MVFCQSKTDLGRMDRFKSNLDKPRAQLPPPPSDINKKFPGLKDASLEDRLSKLKLKPPVRSNPDIVTNIIPIENIPAVGVKPQTMFVVTLSGNGGKPGDSHHQFAAQSITGALNNKQSKFDKVVHLQCDYEDNTDIPISADKLAKQLNKMGIPKGSTIVIVAHSQGTFVAYEMLKTGKLDGFKVKMVAVDPPKVPYIARVGEVTTRHTQWLRKLTQAGIGGYMSQNYNNLCQGKDIPSVDLSVIKTKHHTPYADSPSITPENAHEHNADLSNISNAIEAAAQSAASAY